MLRKKATSRGSGHYWHAVALSTEASEVSAAEAVPGCVAALAFEEGDGGCRSA